MKKTLIAISMATLMGVSASMANADVRNLQSEKKLVEKLLHEQKKDNVRIEFVQSAQSGSLAALPQDPTHYQLTLSSLAEYTNYFSDQPRRITGMISTASFFKYWDDGKINFNKTKPNAAVESVMLQSGDHVNYIFELTNPQYDPTNDKVTYNAKIISKQQPTTGTLGYTTLFIDDYSIKWNGHIP